ncbi:hypothetical protein ONZ45_g10300 [Pleurotus djamor]|nr:hypothetical protein ONZ45_g10300 [Pleurotus djamor]
MTPRLSVVHTIEWPSLSEADIQDKSKGDALAKLLVVAQGLWFVLQLSARFVLHLGVTELEVMTLAYASLTVILYLFWWNKPLDVQQPIPIQISSRNRARASSKADNPTRPLRMFVWGQFIFHLHAILIEEPWMKSENPIISIHLSGSPPGARRSLFFAGVAATGFGAIHCIAWNFRFPSSSEQLLWRISSVIVTASPVLLYLVISAIICLIKARHHYELTGVSLTIVSVIERCVRYAAMFFVPLVLYAYLVARLVLIAESFAVLRDLPPDTFTVIPWASLIPHI